jgi:hypothetical protein
MYFVPENGDSVAARVGGLCLEIELGKACEAVKGVRFISPISTGE